MKMKGTFLFFALVVLLCSCSRNTLSPKVLKKKSPQVFKAKFETTKGNFIVEFHRDWSPLAVDRAYQLIITGFYTDVAFFRVVDKFVAQFGISDGVQKNKFWIEKPITDEPVVMKNVKGTLSFATGGANGRDAQMFINLVSNSPYLDALSFNGVKGFPVVGKITEGEDVSAQLYAGYGEAPRQDSLAIVGNRYLKRAFPKLDYIKEVKVVK